MKHKYLSAVIAPLLVISIVFCILSVGTFAQEEDETATTAASTTTDPGEETTTSSSKTTTKNASDDEDTGISKEDEEKSKKIKAQIAEVQLQIDALKNQSAKIEEYQMALETKATLLQAEIDALNEELEPVEASLKENQAAIKKYKKRLEPLKKQVEKAQEDVQNTKAAMDAVYDNFCSKQKSLYLNGCNSTLELLFGAEDFADFLVRLQLIANIAKLDSKSLADLQTELDDYREVLGELQNKADEVSELEEKIKKTNALVKEQKNTIKSKTASLKEEQEDLIVTMEDYSANLQKIYAKQYDASSQVQQLKEIDNMLNGIEVDEKATGVNSYRTTGFIWPVESCRYISCGFYGYTNHNGIDIPGSYGANIAAIAGGTVVTVVHQTTSYGNYCIIYHGDGIYSLYAHCSVLKVSVGQSVKQGDVIARVGNVGNVRPKPTAQYPYAGSHLHLGIKKNGVWVNPQNYVSP